jgi:hypothetical protein
MSKKKAEIKSLGRLIVNTYPDGVKVLNQVYDVEEHDKTYRILKKTSENQADWDVPTIQRLLKKEKVINGNTQLSEFPMSWSLNYAIWYELEDYEHVLNLLFERNSKTVESLQKRADKAKETASELERQLKETLGGD